MQSPFVPVGIETSGVFGSEAMVFLKELGRKIEKECREDISIPPLENFGGHTAWQQCSIPEVHWSPEHMTIEFCYPFLLLLIKKIKKITINL